MRLHSLFATAIAVAVFALPAAAMATDDGTALQAKHRAFTGWQLGDGSIASLDLIETITTDKDGKTVQTLHTRRLGALYRVDETDAKTQESYSNGFTGNLFWRSDANGMTVPVLGDATKYDLTYDLFLSDAIEDLPWKVTGSTVIDGTSYAIVRVTQDNAFPIDLYVDPATGAYRRAVIDPGGNHEETVNVLGFGDATAGKKIINKWKYAGSSYTHQLTKIVANAGVTASDLHPPAQTASWTFANAAVPIKITQYRIVVNAKVNGVPGKFILDTGASDIHFTEAFARKAGLKPIGESESMGIAGSLKDHVARVDSIDIGGNVLRNLKVSYGGDAIDDDVPDGLLGFSVLGSADVTLDFSNQTLRFQDPSSVDLSAAQGVHVAADLSDGTPVIPMKLNDSVDVLATLDSGNPMSLLMSPQITTKYGLRMLVDNSLVGYLSSHRLIGGVSGHYEATECGHVDQVALGPIKYVYVDACQSPSFSGRDTLVSLDFLRKFDRIEFDYPHAHLVFIPQKQ
jgi:hypothetical protein